MNRRIRKRFLGMAALAVAAAVMAAGCAKKTETPAKSAQETTTAAVTAPAPTTAGTAPAMTAAPTDEMTTAHKPTGAAVNGDSVSIITGTVTDAGTDTVTITTAKYPGGLTFAKGDAATGFADGLLADHEITIFYCGEIKDKDASGTTAELIRDKRDGDEDAQAALVSGRVVSIGMSVVTLETADGGSISFEQDPKPVNTTEGPLEGEQVTIIYSYQDEAHEGAVVPELIRR